MNFIDFIRKNNSDQNGSAIVIALGIFALILALGLNFASQSIINEKVAKNLENKTKADIFLQSSSSRIMAEISTVSTLSNLYSIDPYGGSDTINELQSATINGINYHANPNTEWQYVYNSSDSSNSDSVIIGRIAYSFCNIGTNSSNYGELGKLNAAACVDSGINALNAGTDAVSEDASLSTGTTPSGTTIQGRPGVNVNEIYLVALDDALSDQILEKISAQNTSTGNGMLPIGNDANGGNWLDIQTFFKSADITDSDIQNRLAEKLTTSSTPDKEAFWIDINSDDTISDTEEYFHRFNLTRSDWDNIRPDSFLNNSPSLYSASDADTDGLTISWLKNWQFPGTSTESDTMQNQIIANLIDYCDTDTDVTTDNENTPTYVGLEKLPYINELNINFEGRIKNISSKGDSISYATVWLKAIELEVINMYDETFKDISADVNLEFSFNYNGTIHPATVTTTINLPTISAKSYETAKEKNISNYFYPEIENTSGIYNLKINSLTVKLYNGSALYDYSYIQESASATSFTLIPTPMTSGKKYELFIDYEINDPRQNLYSTDWTGPTESSGTINSKNTACSLPTSGDQQDEEPASEPWDISTAFIRDSSMKSPWELGFIHRAAAWQTINLKKYNSAQGALPTAGGNTYSDGDANILDQIKMTSNATTLGKVNLNNPVTPSDTYSPLSALFYNIRLIGANIKLAGDQPGYYDNSDIPIEIEDATALAQITQNEILDDSDSTLIEDDMFKTRAQLLENITVFSSSAEQTNDALKEEIIGKFINLTKADNKIFNTDLMTVLIYAQSVKDIGGKEIKGISTRKGRFDKGADLILSTTKALTTLSRNPATGKWEIDRFEYFGE